MLATITPKVDQLTADDLIGCTKTIEVTRVKIDTGSEQPVSIYFVGDNNKPFRPGKSMRRVLVQVWGADANEYVGRSMTLYRDDGVKFGGLEVGGIRISHMSGITSQKVMALTEKKGSKKPFTVRPLVMAKPAPTPTPAPAAADMPSAPTAEPDKAVAVAEAIVQRIQAIHDMQALEGITAEEAVIKQRAWMASKRPDLATRVDDAVRDALYRFETAAAQEVA